jgi:hypothetical protein
MQKSDSDLMASIREEPLSEESHSFVIRLWSEAGDELETTAEWRGWVQHAQNGERCYFRDLAEVSQIVATHLIETPGT